MNGRVSPQSIVLPDYRSLGWIVRADGGVYGIPARVIVARETPYGLMVARSVPCSSLDEARAVAAAMTAEVFR